MKSLRHAAEINNTVNQLYFNNFKKITHINKN